MQIKWIAAYLGLGLVPILTLGSFEAAARRACSPRGEVIGHLAKKYGEAWRTMEHDDGKLAPAT